MGHDLRFRDDANRGHPRGIEDPLPQELPVGRSRDLAHDAAEDHVTRVRVVPASTRLELEGQAISEFQEVGLGVILAVVHLIAGVVRNAGGVGQQTAQSDRLPRLGGVWQPGSHGVVELQAFVLHEGHDARRRELFSERA